MQDGSERRRLPSTPDCPRGPARSPALEPMHGVRGIADAIASPAIGICFPAAQQW